MSSAEPADRLFPLDEYNQTLLSYTHPPDWVNPRPAPCYDLVVIGAGTAGLVTAGGAATLGVGLKVALIEKHLMGGDCLNFGCVPSKTVIRSARVVAELRQAAALGIQVGEIGIDFAAVMARMRRVRAQISPHDSVQRFSQEFGVDVFLGTAQFESAQTIAVAGQVLRFKKAVIATGARAAHPAIPGLAETGFLTNETVFSLTERPERLAVIGGGPIGCELAQAFSALGCQVALLHKHDRLLEREDPEASTVLQQVFQQQGIRLILSSQIERVERSATGKVIHFRQNGASQSLIVDQILVAVGRQPNLEGLNLAAVGVQSQERRGVCVNDYLQTTNPRIYAAGDICMDWKFTHAADAAARIVIRNALFAPFGLGRARLSSLVMPWTTYTLPEVAHVGLYPQEAACQNIPVETICVPMTDVDRAIADAATEGFVKIYHRKGTDQILGATIVAPHAGEMINEITLAITQGIGLNQLANVIHPYPTQSEAVRKAAETYNLKQLTAGPQLTLLKLVNWLS
uniref:Pyridine nucleotide-disulphide oxidoreductase dimerisation region n=1 Tax=Cyanothece sp. (strain PCC 7425 / ATCC 29141) TaxID=395961 RepID=B8HTB5_CYAP4